MREHIMTRGVHANTAVGDLAPRYRIDLLVGYIWGRYKNLRQPWDQLLDFTYLDLRDRNCLDQLSRPSWSEL